MWLDHQFVGIICYNVHVYHIYILNQSQCQHANKEALSNSNVCNRKEILYNTERLIIKTPLPIILAFWFFWVSQFLTSEELCWHLFCEGSNLSQIQRCHVPIIKWNKVKYMYKSLISKYIIQIWRKTTQKEVRNLLQWHLDLIYESWLKGIPLKLFHWEAFQPVISFPRNSTREAFIFKQQNLIL